MTTSTQGKWVQVKTPDGPFIVVSAFNRVLASGWASDVSKLTGLIHPSINPQALVYDPDDEDGWGATVSEYYAGSVGSISRYPVSAIGGPFTEQVWDAVRALPPGEPTTYRRLAEQLGDSAKEKAVVRACAINPVALFIPCHRVIASKTDLGIYRFGPTIKFQLLQHEATHAYRTR